MSVSLQGQTALVVGASSGIGRETARLLKREGMQVMASARREDRLRTLEPEGIEVFSADAGKLDTVERLVDHTLSRFGHLDLVVYATGTNTPDRALTRLKPAIWDELIRVNLTGAYYVTQAVLPAMREAKSGHLIYVSSISGLYPDASGAAYQASKRGMNGMAHAIRVEEGANGIRTCVVCPGLVDTEILNNRPVKPTAEMLAKALQPEDVAEAVLAVAKLPPRVCVPELIIVPTVLV